MERDAIFRSLILLFFALFSYLRVFRASLAPLSSPFLLRRDDRQCLGELHRPRLGEVTPMTTIPIINPTNPFATTPILPSPPADPYTTPPLTTRRRRPARSRRSWCVASPTASQTALQVALDYACGYGWRLLLPNTLRDHASYAFNSYYQKNPLPTSCDFGGTAILTTTDPSSLTCRFPAASASSSVVIGPTNPAGSGPTVLGSTPPSVGDTAAATATYPTVVIFTLACLSSRSSDTYKIPPCLPPSDHVETGDGGGGGGVLGKGRINSSFGSVLRIIQCQSYRIRPPFTSLG
ncbi:unnamed protein product [Spirodela intermedia]|uniref:X8 domain-containing protein n=1 Tax=Spirodela intermedia TaxID=51605 RepID=A0A7I8JME9_SPIIN|nr:unnamed protein product [Spirodela intermedia]CAA6671338.1 unnamed protein product [Spirodela intermedia]